jgi:hypothetical protein
MRPSSLQIETLRIEDSHSTLKPDFAVARHMSRLNIIKSITYTFIYDTHRYTNRYVTY